ncbi:MAG TPA: rod shape-determining protein MreC [Acidimicrobiia bacterium]
MPATHPPSFRPAAGRGGERPLAVRPPLVAVLVAAALSLILVGRPGGLLVGPLGSLRAVTRGAFVPVEAAGAAAFRPLGAIGAGFHRGGELTRARAEAARRREEAGSQAARAAALEAENARLAALLHLDGPAGGDGVAARVVSTGGPGSGATVVLDRGSHDGIGVGMPVVAAGGLVGRILEVGPGQSIVLPVTAATSAVGIHAVAPVPPTPGASGAGPAGVAQGRGGPGLRLDLLDPNAPVSSGDLAVTSGLRHSLFPAGLPVGRVTGSRGHLGVEPFAPPDRLEVVKVLRWRPEP